ncbi:MAG: hypothetical protein AAGF12_07360 [Myxococcota bacterium]
MDRVRKCWIPADLGREDTAAVLDVPRGRLEGEGRGRRPGEGGAFGRETRRRVTDAG